MLEKLMTLIKKLTRIFSRISSAEEVPSAAQLRVIPWLECDGDNTLRLDYDLNENSLCLDLGGYEGNWSRDIYCKYSCNIHIFEPVPQFAINIKQKFLKNPKIEVHTFGLSDKNERAQIFLNKDATSAYKKNLEIGSEIVLKRASDFFSAKKIHYIDLMKINIEGGEYDLLDHLIETGVVSKIKNIQIQFHDFVPNAEDRMKTIQEKLAQTHYLTYQYEFVWENWKQK